MAEVQTHNDTITRLVAEIDKPIPSSPFEDQINEISSTITDL
jgi:hypothetical protein